MMSISKVRARLYANFGDRREKKSIKRCIASG